MNKTQDQFTVSSYYQNKKNTKPLYSWKSGQNASSKSGKSGWKWLRMLLF